MAPDISEHPEKKIIPNLRTGTKIGKIYFPCSCPGWRRCVTETLVEGFLWMRRMISIIFSHGTNWEAGFKYFYVTVASEGKWETIFLGEKTPVSSFHLNMAFLSYNENPRVGDIRWRCAVLPAKRLFSSCHGCCFSLSPFCMLTRPAWSSYTVPEHVFSEQQSGANVGDWGGHKKGCWSLDM